MLNDSGPRYKQSKLEKMMNRDVVFSVIILVVLCCIGEPDMMMGPWPTRSSSSVIRPQAMMDDYRNGTVHCKFKLCIAPS